ncbi:MAG: hypothetical protein EYC69_05845 [Bacteroidetes bacterium]|nr:MAG: hypothetical protein EYC69_05845 [Bacteroidota bacterium]
MCLIIALILCASVLGQVVNAESTDTSKIHLMELWSNEHVSNEYNLSSVDIKDSNNILLKEFSGPFSISPNRKLYAILDHKLNNYKIHPHYSVLKIYNSHRELIDSTLLGSSAFRIILSNDTQVAIVHSFFHGNNVNNRTYKL